VVSVSSSNGFVSIDQNHCIENLIKPKGAIRGEW